MTKQELLELIGERAEEIIKIEKSPLAIIGGIKPIVTNYMLTQQITSTHAIEIAARMLALMLNR